MLMIVYKDKYCVAYMCGAMCVTAPIVNIHLSKRTLRGWYDHTGKPHFINY